MADIFNRNVTVGGSWAADATVINIDATLMATQLQFTYKQAITRVYVLSSASVYLVSGRTQGNMTIGSVIGPGADVKAFWAKYGNLCGTAQNLTLNFSPGNCGSSVGSTTSLVFSNVVIEQVGGQVQAQDMIVALNTQTIFVGLT